MTLQEAKLFVRNYDNYIKLFGEEMMQKIFSNFNVDDFSKKEYVELGGGGDNYYARLGYPVTIDRTTTTFKEYKGEWEREVIKPARQYLIRCPYQLEEKSVLRSCILAINPMMSLFDMSTYHLDKETDDVYITTEVGHSLYVPVKAIVEKNYALVVERHTAYHKSYYCTDDRKEYLDKALAALDSKTAKILKIVIEDNL